MILLLGGTTEGRELSKMLQKEGLDFLITVTTEYGRDLLDLEENQIIKERLDELAMKALVKDRKVNLIIDATHPYAQEASKTAIRVAEDLKIKYIRLERKSEEFGSDIYLVENVEEAAKKASELEGIVFLSTGSKNLDEFCHIIDKDRIVARVLPTSEVIQKCEQLGLRAHQIIAMKGPFSKELNKELLKASNSSIMITKESGKTGGFKEKLDGARELGLQIIVISRPALNYPLKFSTPEEVLREINGGK